MQTLDYEDTKKQYEKPETVDSPGVAVSIGLDRAKRLLVLKIGETSLLLTPGQARDLARGLMTSANKLPKK